MGVTFETKLPDLMVEFGHPPEGDGRYPQIVISADKDAWCPVNSVRTDGVIHDEMLRRSFIFGSERLWAEQLDGHRWDGFAAWASGRLGISRI